MHAADSPNGVYTFDSLRVLTEHPTTFAAILARLVPRNMRQTISEHIWRRLRLFQLTVNLIALRMATVPTEIQGGSRRCAL